MIFFFKHSILLLYYLTEFQMRRDFVDMPLFSKYGHGSLLFKLPFVALISFTINSNKWHHLHTVKTKTRGY